MKGVDGSVEQRQRVVGLTTGEISADFSEIYGASVSRETVSRITGRVLEEMQAWATRPLDEVYAAIFIDAVVVKIRDGQVGNQPIYAAIGVTVEGEREPREPQRPLPGSGPGPGTFPDRGRRTEMPLPGHPIASPDRGRQDTMGNALEASTQRLRYHLRRPIPSRRNLLRHGQKHR